MNFKQYMSQIGILDLQTRNSLHSPLNSDLELTFDKQMQLASSDSTYPLAAPTSSTSPGPQHPLPSQSVLEDALFKFLSGLTPEKMKLVCRGVVDRYFSQM